jgi:hypothetical protein
MKLLKRLSGSEHEQKKSVRMARLIVPLFLALTVFGFLGFFGLNQTSASAASCGDTVVKSAEQFGGYGTDVDMGLAKLIKNTCTNLYHTEFVCVATNFPLSVELGSGEDVSDGGFYTHNYGAVSTNCSTVGQVVDSGTHAQDNSVFCAYSAGGNDISNAFVEYGLCVGRY